MESLRWPNGGQWPAVEHTVCWERTGVTTASAWAKKWHVASSDSSRRDLTEYSNIFMKARFPNESIDLKLRSVDQCPLVVAAKTLSSVITLKYMNTSMWRICSEVLVKLASQNVRYNSGFKLLLSEESSRLSDELSHPLVNPSHHQLSMFRFSLVKFAWSCRSWTFQPSITF